MYVVGVLIRLMPEPCEGYFYFPRLAICPLIAFPMSEYIILKLEFIQLATSIRKSVQELVKK